jgi:CubicO group peptidase (beta-lactamase class C family)
VTHGGRLIYLKAYGQQDKAAGLAATAKSRFRIASVSKPITAVAILRLAEQGRLKLSDKVFGVGALLGTRYGSRPYGPDLQAITVDHLLHHTAGGWPNTRGDPMFMDPSLSVSAVIDWTLDNVALTSWPGAAYAYSNFGYCLLGRIIEQVTGQPYEQAVQELVLHPAGSPDMAIGGNTLAERRPNEVVYEGSGDDPYAFNVTRMDAHGGWIATARDLAAFLVAVDGYDTRPDLLSPGSTLAMTTPSSANPNYAAGWLVNSANNWWHAGSLPGTATEIIRGANGYNFVVLANSRSAEPGFFEDLDALLWTALSHLQDEPSYDLLP